MKPPTRRGGRPTRTADRTPTPGEAAERFLTPWDAYEVADWLGCSERTLRRLRDDPDAGFPAPMAGPRLQWWPADVLAWSGVPLREAIVAATVVEDSLNLVAEQAAAAATDDAACEEPGSTTATQPGAVPSTAPSSMSACFTERWTEWDEIPKSSAIWSWVRPEVRATATTSRLNSGG